MHQKEDFADLKFRIECDQMVLARLGATPVTVQGPGEIWQDEEGRLLFKVFADQAGYGALIGEMGRPVVVGDLIGDEEYFSLEARELGGTVWKSPRVLPLTRGNLATGLAHGTIHEMYNVDAVQENQNHDYVAIRLKDKIDFPCNTGTETVIRVGGVDRHRSASLNAAFVQDSGYDFRILHERNHTLITLQLPHGQLTAAMPSRIIEALQFVLGEQLVPLVIGTTHGGELKTQLNTPRKGKGQLQPPLMYKSVSNGGKVWSMFLKYFHHVRSNRDPGWHHISRHIGSVLESTAASLEVEALSLAVAVEGIVAECFSKLSPVEDDLLHELDSVEAAVEGLNLRENTLKRIRGTISQMRGPRNSDLVRAFILKNNLPEGLYKSWSTLRNTSAHGGGGGGRDVEQTLKLVGETLYLLYSMVFAVIGYEGPRTDYSSRGWPQADWPVVPIRTDVPVAEPIHQQPAQPVNPPADNV